METQINLNSKATPAEVAGDSSSPRHATEYQQFIEWLALPVKERSPNTQKELADQFGLSEWTISQWKLRTGFWVEVEKVKRTWAHSKTPEIIYALCEKAKSGDVGAIKIWLQHFDDFAEKNKSDVAMTSIEMTHQEWFKKVMEKIRKDNAPENRIVIRNDDPIPSSDGIINYPDLPASYKKYNLQD